MQSNLPEGQKIPVALKTKR